MDYIFRRLALDHLPYKDRAELGILAAAEVVVHDPAERSGVPAPAPAPPAAAAS